jgi:hypothetical protein
MTEGLFHAIVHPLHALIPLLDLSPNPFPKERGMQRADFYPL